MIDEKHQINLFITSYFLDDLIVIGYRKKLLHLPPTVIATVTTTTINPLIIVTQGLFKSLWKYGYDKDSPCQFELEAIDHVP